MKIIFIYAYMCMCKTGIWLLMITIENKVECCGCSACFNMCPQKCISMIADGEGFLYPNVNDELCIHCNLCNKVCPFQSPPPINSFKCKAFACKSKDDSVREKSSSGGVFSLLAELVIGKNGVVFGAAFDDDMKLSHNFAESLVDCQKFRGSKYLQSEIGNSYQQVKEFLQQDRLVMFTGTPCQIDGLLLFLGKSDENLLLVDVVCHGVPSPKVWEKYLKELEAKNGKIINFSFRDKSYGWKNYALKAGFSTGKIKTQLSVDSSYMQTFLCDLSTRPSCYHCNSKLPKKYADVSLGDYWGVSSKYPEMDDDLGTSLILVCSKKGGDFFSKIKRDMEFIQVDLMHAVSHNSCIVKSAVAHKNRSIFFQELENYSLKNY